MTTFDMDRDEIDPGPSVERRVDQLLLRDAVRLTLEDLSTERRQVLSLWFGLADDTGVNRGSYTFEEIARVLNISRERAAAVCATTLLRLRNRMAAVRRLTPFLHLLFAETWSSHTIDYCHVPRDKM